MKVLKNVYDTTNQDLFIPLMMKRRTALVLHKVSHFSLPTNISFAIDARKAITINHTKELPRVQSGLVHLSSCV